MNSTIIFVVLLLVLTVMSFVVAAMVLWHKRYKRCCRRFTALNEENNGN